MSDEYADFLRATQSEGARTAQIASVAISRLNAGTPPEQIEDEALDCLIAWLESARLDKVFGKYDSFDDYQGSLPF